SSFDQGEGTKVAERLLARILYWQQNKAGKVEKGKMGRDFVLPEKSHPLFFNDKALESFLKGLLRIYDDSIVRDWLAERVLEDGFAGQARESRPLRLMALWLAAVFDHPRSFAVLGKIYKDYTFIQEMMSADCRGLAGTALEQWHNDWTVHLNLRDLEPRRAVFDIGQPDVLTPANSAAITVIIPCYNHERFVGRAIQSVLGQTQGDFTLLVIDDASSDKTCEEVEKITDPRIQLIRNAENMGIGSTISKALDHVATDLVAILNSDDLFHSRRLEKSLQYFENNESCSLLATELVPIDEQDLLCSRKDSTPIFDGHNMYHWLCWYRETHPTQAPEDLFNALLGRNFLLTSS
ncbi:MAG: glycosyltransferase family 2 protein, partial [Candidatus Electrothrix sp. MAN1_4]|nr:glycosyltransferase family 2 protein [Candidatus Electrothrix sp. MAN1_4]